MSFWQSLTRIKNKTPHQPDFERFVRAITTCEPGPVPFGDIFADHETVGNFLGERVFDYAAMAADPEHKITWQDFRDGLRYVDQTIHFCLARGWDYAYSFSAIPFPGFTYNLAENTSTEIKEDRQRFWVDDNPGPIQTWDDFERYPWPKIYTASICPHAGWANASWRVKEMVIPAVQRVDHHLPVLGCGQADGREYLAFGDFRLSIGTKKLKLLPDWQGRIRSIRKLPDDAPPVEETFNMPG